MKICCNTSGKISNTEENIKKCESFIEKWNWECPGLKTWIVFGDENIELFVDVEHRNYSPKESIEKKEDYYWWDFDNFALRDYTVDSVSYPSDGSSDDPEYVSFEQWYEKNFGIAMLFDSRIHILQSGSHENAHSWEKNFDSLHDDNSILFDLVQLFGTLEIVISKDKDTFKLQCDYHKDWDYFNDNCVKLESI